MSKRHKIIKVIGAGAIAASCLAPNFAFASDDRLNESDDRIERQDESDHTKEKTGPSIETDNKKRAGVAIKLAQATESKRKTVSKIIELYRVQADDEKEAELSNWSARVSRASSDLELINVAKEIQEARARDKQTEKIKKANEQALKKIQDRVTVLTKQLMVLSKRAEKHLDSSDQAQKVLDEADNQTRDLEALYERASLLKLSPNIAEAVEIQSMSQQLDQITRNIKLLARKRL